MKKFPVWLLVGDALIFVLVTLIGFAAHGEGGLAMVPRMFTTFLPLLVAWGLIAPWLGLFQPSVTDDARQLWRPVWGMLLAAPMVAVLRAAMLNSAALPIFTLVLGSSAALGLLLWRSIWWGVRRQRNA